MLVIICVIVSTSCQIKKGNRNLELEFGIIHISFAMDKGNLKSPTPRRKRLPTTFLLLGTVFLFSICITIFNQGGLFSGDYVLKSENDDDFTNLIEGSFASDGESDDGNQNVNIVFKSSMINLDNEKEERKESSEDDYYAIQDAQEDIDEIDDDIAIDVNKAVNEAFNIDDEINVLQDVVAPQTTDDDNIGNVKEDSNENNRDDDDEVDDDQRMNILILYPDDWRHDTLGSEKPYVLTPFLNSLAKEGIRFTQNAVVTSICWMSRATLFTGQYSSRHQSYKIKCPRFSTRENWKHSWVSLIQKAGYFVGHVGKWQYHTRQLENLFDWSRFHEGNYNLCMISNCWTTHVYNIIQQSFLSFFA